MNPVQPMWHDDLVRAVVESASDAIVCKNLQGVVLGWNPAAQRLFGYLAHEIVGQSVTRLIPAERLHEEAMILATVGRGERVDCLETLRRCRDGSLLPVSITVSPVFDAQGQVIGASKIARPIEHLLRARRREQQLAQIVRGASDAILVLDDAGDIEFANPAVQSLFGWSDTELQGESLQVLLSPQARPQMAQALRSLGDAPAAPRPARQPGHWIDALHRDGSVVPVEISLSCFGEGDLARRMALVRDRRPQQEADRLQQAVRQADAATQAKSSFIARMSHELCTPLTVVLGFTELLQADPATATERARGLVTHIRSAGLHLLTLIDDLLDAARIERGLLRLQMQAVPLHALLEDLQQQVGVVASTTRQHIELQPLPPGACVQADPVRLRQVLYNLLSNALKYSPPESTVTLRVSTHDRGWRIDVIDRGAGIAPDRLDKLFTPFDRLGRESSGVPGVGLGLATVRELVDAMGGEVAVYSAPGHGSTFSVTLDVAAVDDTAGDRQALLNAEVRITTETTATAKPAPLGARLIDTPKAVKRLLCVDDNPVNRLLIDAALGDTPGLALSFAVDGQSATRTLDKRPVDLVLLDLVLLDLVLPDVHGLEWLKTMREDPRHAQLRVVLFTAATDAATFDVARELCVVDVINKPFDVFTLQQRIQQLLQ